MIVFAAGNKFQITDASKVEGVQFNDDIKYWVTGCRFVKATGKFTNTCRQFYVGTIKPVEIKEGVEA